MEKCLSELIKFARCYDWGATSEYRLKVAVLMVVGHFGPKFQVEGDVPYQPYYVGELDASTFHMM